MSDLSEALDEALHNLAENSGENGVDAVVDINGQQSIQQLTALRAMQSRYQVETAKIIRRLYRREAGSRPYDSPDDAFDRVMQITLSEMVRLAAYVVSDGVQIGQEKAVVKKYRVLNQMDNIYQSAAFCHDTEMLAISYLQDYEFCECLESYVKGAVTLLSNSTGYRFLPPERYHKVWDLWSITMNSVVIGLFAAGQRMGALESQKETLMGILEATEVDND